MTTEQQSSSMSLVGPWPRDEVPGVQGTKRYPSARQVARARYVACSVQASSHNSIRGTAEQEHDAGATRSAVGVREDLSLPGGSAMEGLARADEVGVATSEPKLLQGRCMQRLPRVTSNSPSLSEIVGSVHHVADPSASSIRASVPRAVQGASGPFVRSSHRPPRQWQSRLDAARDDCRSTRCRSARGDAEPRTGSGCVSDGGGVRNGGRCGTDAARLARRRAARRPVGKAVGVFAQQMHSRRQQPQVVLPHRHTRSQACSCAMGARRRCY